jgi:hypothetical protein
MYLFVSLYTCVHIYLFSFILCRMIFLLSRSRPRRGEQFACIPTGRDGLRLGKRIVRRGLGSFLLFVLWVHDDLSFVIEFRWLSRASISLDRTETNRSRACFLRTKFSNCLVVSTPAYTSARGAHSATTQPPVPIPTSRHDYYWREWAQVPRSVQ